MRRCLIRTVGHKWILQDTGQHYNRVWHRHTHLSRSLSGCWTAAWNSAVLCGFYWLHQLVVRGSTGWVGPWGFFLSLLWLCSLVHCLIAQRVLPFTALCAIRGWVSGLVVPPHPTLLQRHTAMIGEPKLKWLLNNLTTGFSLVHQPCSLDPADPEATCTQIQFDMHAHRWRLLKLVRQIVA